MGLIYNTLLGMKKNEILEELGFEYRDSHSDTWTGYTKTFKHASDSERLWVVINVERNTVYCYNEYDCGGQLWDSETELPEGILESKEKFVKWLDEKIDID